MSPLVENKKVKIFHIEEICNKVSPLQVERRVEEIVILKPITYFKTNNNELYIVILVDYLFNISKHRGNNNAFALFIDYFYIINI